MNLAERALTGNITGPAPTPCSIYTAAMGTAVVFSVGLAVVYSGYGLYNPLVTPTGSHAVKLVPLEATIIPSGVSTANNTFSLAKYIGTGTAFAGGASTGGVTQMGLAGTTTLQNAVVFGTGSFSIAPIYVKQLYGMQAGTGAGTSGYASATFPGVFKFDGDLTVMPGEGVLFAQGIAGTAIASITWAEVPI